MNSSEASIIEYLNSRRGKVISKTGGWFAGDGVYSHGYDMLNELVGEKSYFQILILNATGKLVERRFADWVEAIYGCLSWPDPRIWCNQIGALAGSARASVVAATTMGSLASDSRAYGVLPLIEGITFIQNAMHAVKNGSSSEEVVGRVVAANKGKPYIVGYKRPIAKGDERLEVMERVSADLGFEEGPHILLAYEIEKILLRDFNEGMNINGFVSAFLSDMGFTAKEAYQIFSCLVSSGVTACYLDTLRQPAESFLPLQCQDVEYRGEVDRDVPEK